jgi:hypothetical protein
MKRLLAESRASLLTAVSSWNLSCTAVKEETSLMERTVMFRGLMEVSSHIKREPIAECEDVPRDADTVGYLAIKSHPSSIFGTALDDKRDNDKLTVNKVITGTKKR